MAHPDRPHCLREPSVRLIGLPGELVTRIKPALARDEQLSDFVLRAIEREIAERRERAARLKAVASMIA
jgi:hypothetical protein